MVPNMRAPFDDTMGADKYVMLQMDVFNFLPVREADAFQMRIGAINGYKRSNVTIVFNNDSSAFSIDFRHAADVDVLANLWFSIDPDQGMKPVLSEMR